MKLKIINSGSVGNCYLLIGTNTTLIIEAGVNFQLIKQALNFDLTRVAGIILTHEHGDHSKGVKDATASGINVYASPGTIGAMKFTSHRLKPITANNQYSIGEFIILPFDVKHDCAEPFGFIINHPECGNVLFITDSYYVPNLFPGLNNILIEANYSEPILAERERLPYFVRDRVIKSHMSLETCMDVLRANDLSRVNNIVLIHLSDGNSNADQFQREVSNLTGKTVHIAGKGMEIPFGKMAF